MGASEILSGKAVKNGSDSVDNINKKYSNVDSVGRSQDDEDLVNVQGYVDEREEGEIVDDYEFIISSDEEFCMRQRIEELEATNAELEKIAKIACNSDEYTMDTQRAAQVPTDASSISSVEFPTPKKHKKRKSKESKLNAFDSNQQSSKRVHKHLTENQRSNHKKYKHSSKRANMRSHKPVEEHSYSNECSNFDRDDKYKREGYISREELRFAVTRFTNAEMNSVHSKPRTGLEIEKRKLSTQDSNTRSNFYTNQKSEHSIEEILVDANSSDSMSLEEQELRLIALKSAVMKKHLARKKRDAEVAYSPTDFEDVIANNTLNGNQDDDMDVVEEEIDQLEHNSKNSMEISPVASPKLNLSHEEEENSRMSMATETTEVNQIENTRLVDMDIANSDSDNELPPYDDDDKKKWSSIDQIPLSTTNESRSDGFRFSCNGIMNPMHYSSFFPEYLFEPPPLPPGVSCNEEQPPPPPPYHLKKKGSIKKDFNTLSCQDNVQSWCVQNTRQINAHNEAFVESPCNSVESSKDHVIFQTGEENEENDEEEKALRALLLSKFNNSKVFQLQRQKVNISRKENNCKQISEPENLNCILSPKIYERISSKNPTETILKEAVRRLTLKISSVHSGYIKEEWDNSVSNVDRNLRNSPSIEPETSTLQINQVSQNSVSVLNDRQDYNLPLTFKEGESKANLSESNSSGQNSSGSKVKKRQFLKVRSVKKINGSICVEKKVNSPKLNQNISESLIQNVDFVNILDSEDVSNNFIDDRLIKKLSEECPKTSNTNTLAKQTLIGNEDNVNTLKIDTQLIPIEKESCKHSEGENTIKKVDVNKDDYKTRRGLKGSQEFLLNKITKPNKTINTQSEIKRKSEDIVKVPEKTPKTASKSSSPQTTSVCLSSSNASRLIINTDISKIKVNKLVISLRASDTDNSDEESLSLVKSSNCCLNEPYLETLKPLTCSVNNDNYDNASPISLPMDSPGITPNRSNSPSEEFLVTNSGLSESLVNDCFKEKLDSFLKNMRTQVQQAVCQPIKKKENETQKENTPSSKKFHSTAAMRHLPQASQQEYRRLVRRMQLLEKQKQSRNKDKPVREDSNRLSPQKATLENKQNAPLPEFAKGTNENSLCKKVLLKNAIYTAPLQKSNDTKSVLKNNTAQHKSSKLNVLRAYENSFLKTGTGIVTNLDKSLQLVTEAKKAKMEKLQYEKRIQELRTEMEEVQQKLKHAQQNISRVYPEICESNELITTLKQRRNKLLKAATSLGKLIKGDDYRLNNDLKQQITMKSKLLAGQIKFINSMRYSDIEKVKQMLEYGGSSESSSLNHKIQLDKEQGCLNERQFFENFSILSETESDRSERNTHTKVPLKSFKDSTENRENEFFDTNNINKSEIPSSNDDNKNQEKDLNEPPEKNDVFSNESTEIKEDVSKKDQSASAEEVNNKNLVPEYISPLLSFKSTESTLDPNGIICPYELMGECVDKDCNYMHINVK